MLSKSCFAEDRMIVSAAFIEVRHQRCRIQTIKFSFGGGIRAHESRCHDENSQNFMISDIDASSEDVIDHKLVMRKVWKSRRVMNSCDCWMTNRWLCFSRLIRA